MPQNIVLGPLHPSLLPNQKKAEPLLNSETILEVTAIVDSTLGIVYRPHISQPLSVHCLHTMVNSTMSNPVQLG